MRRCTGTVNGGRVTEHHPKKLPKPVASNTAHSILGASNSHRWLECPASVRMEQMFPDTTSAYAEEGTIAHELAAYCLKNGIDAKDAPAFPGEDPMTKTWCSDLWNAEMRDHVQEYIDLVRVLPGDLMVEVRVDYSRWAPEGFGTSDAIRPHVARKVCYVADLKYGTGIKVFAEDNSQGKLYALGVLNELGYLYSDDDIGEFEIIVKQPRLDHQDHWRITREDLLAWAENVVKPRAALALTQDAPFNPGEKQCGFCRARAHCKARADANLKFAQEMFGNMPAPETLSEAEVATILSRSADFKKWIGDIEERAFQDATRHKVKFPGWKLVEGRSNRRINNPEMLAQALELEGFDHSEIYEPREIIGLGKLEKLLGKKHPIIKEFTFRPTGAPVLVPESDKRPALETMTAQEAFKDIDDL